MKKCLMIVAVLGVLGGLILVGTSWSQNDPRPNSSSVAPAKNPFQRQEMGIFDGAPRVPSARSEIGRLMNELREADDDKKAGLMEHLDAWVEKYFDEDLETRETELTKLEERLTKLRAQLDRRRKAKTEIIQLQIKVLTNEAEGLGFSGASFFEPGRSPGGMSGMGSGSSTGFGGASPIAITGPSKTTSTTPAGGAAGSPSTKKK